MIYSEERIRKKIQQLYQKSPEIHISMSQTRPKISLKNTPAKIVGMYLHFFRVEVTLNGRTQCYSIRYADIQPNQIDIQELLVV